MLYELIEDGKSVGGKFEISKTKNGFTIKMIEKPYFMLGDSEMAFNNKTHKVTFATGRKTKHAVRKLPNNEYVIYFYQSGIPCHFKIINGDIYKKISDSILKELINGTSENEPKGILSIIDRKEKLI